jgi:hypothetical protein
MVIPNNFGGTNATLIDIGEWNINFTPATQAITLAPSATNYGQMDLTGGLTTSQNVGIGTINPQATLDVNGTINASSGYNLSYSTVPTYTSTQIGYILNGSFSTTTTYTAGTAYNISIFSNVPIGVWILYAQVHCNTGQNTNMLLYISTSSGTTVGFGGYGYQAVTATDNCILSSFGTVNTVATINVNFTPGVTTLLKSLSNFRMVRIA